METVTSRCIDCHQAFMYTRNWGVYGHFRQRCDKCQVEHRRKITRDRVRRYRENKAQENPPTKTAPAATHQPASVGARLPLARVGKPARSVGLYADLPEPDRTDKRRKVGIADR